MKSEDANKIFRHLKPYRPINEVAWVFSAGFKITALEIAQIETREQLLELMQRRVAELGASLLASLELKE
jgi:hypothetical protein